MTYSTRNTNRRDRKLRHLTLERLERRALLSLGPEFSSTVNTTTRNAQFDSANASSANGSSVVVWVDTFHSNDGDIRAQRFNASGGKVGPEILVSGSSLDETQPTVAMDNLGNFVVAWRQTQANGDTNVIARRFKSSGTPTGSVVQVGVGTFKEHDPSVAMDAVGDFVVAYTRDTNNTDPDVFAKRFGSSNQLLGVTNVAVTAHADDKASVAMTPDGRFDVAWEHAFSATDHDIVVQRYSKSGTLLGSSQVGASTAFESHPSVAIDISGNAVVTWQKTIGGNTSVQARRMLASGIVGNLISISTASFGDKDPSVAIKRVGGGFVVAYQVNTKSGIDTRVAEVSAIDAVLTTFDAGIRSSPAVSINGLNNYLVTYTSSDSGDLNIRLRIGKLS